MSSSGEAAMGPPSSSGTRITRRVSVLKKLRNSFRRKKESYCISCGHVTRNCCHHSDVYENVEFNQKDDLLKWLDLDLSHNNNLRLKYQVIENIQMCCLDRNVWDETSQTYARPQHEFYRYWARC